MLSNRLKQDGIAPVFSVEDLHGRTIDLEAYRGRWLLLSFYRYASCPLCNLRVHEISKLSPQWARQGLDVVGVFQSPREKILNYLGRQEVAFTLLPDPQQKLYAVYQVRHSWAGFIKAWLMRLPEIYRSVIRKQFYPGTVEGGIHRIPADFLIDPAGRLAVAYYGKDIGDHLPVARIEAVLKAGLDAGHV